MPIVQYWHSEDVPHYMGDLFQTFGDLNPDRPHLVFDRRSAASFISQHLGPRRLRAFQACAIPAMQADYFRYCAILVLGGAYCDADTRCVASLSSMIPTGRRGRVFLRRDGVAVLNAYFAFGSPGHPLLELALDVATRNIERRVDDSIYAVTGPLIFTNLYRLHRLGSFDALIDFMADRRYAGPARTLCESIDDYDRVSQAFEGVTVSPDSENTWICGPGRPLPYKQTGTHWTKFEGGIYR